MRTSGAKSLFLLMPLYGPTKVVPGYKAKTKYRKELLAEIACASPLNIYPKPDLPMQICGMSELSECHRSDALYQETTLTGPSKRPTQYSKELLAEIACASPLII
jgi:hypothetical protein